MNSDIKSIIFVCLGNICRSPLAEGIAKKKAKELGLDLKIESAGTGSWHVGENPCPDSVKVAKQNGIDISNYKAFQIDRNTFDSFDLVITMDGQNSADLSSRGMRESVKIGDYGLDGADIPDPYFFNGFEGFPKVFSMIEEGVNNIFDKNF